MGHYELGDRAVQQIAALVRSELGRYLPLPKPTRRSRSPSPDMVGFYNSTQETIPAYAVMRVTGVTQTGSGQYYTVAKPNSDTHEIYLVNEGADVAAGTFGVGSWRSEPGRVLCNASPSTPDIDETWGPENGQWYLKKGKSGFTTIGGLEGAGSTAQTWAFQRAKSEETYVDYLLNTGVKGWNGIDNPKLDSTHANGWVGTGFRAGSESIVGIEYDKTEADPDTNGNWLVKKTGLYRITLSGFFTISLTGSPPTYSTDSFTSGPASTGTAHTHSVGIPQYYTIVDGPSVIVSLYRKPSSGSMAIYEDEVETFRRWWAHFPRPYANHWRVPFNTEWNMNFDADDRIALLFSWTHQGRYTLTLVDGYAPFMRVSYLGDKKEWAAIT